MSANPKVTDVLSSILARHQKTLKPHTPVPWHLEGRDADETLDRVDAMLAFLQDVVVRPNPDMEDWSDREKYGIHLVFEEVV